MKIFQGQKGVTLIIAVVMLASVTFVSFALSSVIIREIRVARILLKTEPAISGANSGGEENLYRFIRKQGLVTSGSLPQSAVNYQVTPDFFDNPYNFTIAANSFGRIALYDPENPTNPAANYGTIRIVNNGPSISRPILYQVYSLGNLSTAICSGTVGVSQTSPVCNLNSADDRYIVDLQLSGFGSGGASGSITVMDNGGNPKGAPADVPKMEVLGSVGEVRRKIEINLR